jgi:hypothetical protein
LAVFIFETALLSPRSDGKPETATAVVVAPDDGHEDALYLTFWHRSFTFKF